MVSKFQFNVQKKINHIFGPDQPKSESLLSILMSVSSRFLSTTELHCRALQGMTDVNKLIAIFELTIKPRSSTWQTPASLENGKSNLIKNKCDNLEWYVAHTPMTACFEETNERIDRAEVQRSIYYTASKPSSFLTDSGECNRRAENLDHTARQHQQI